MEKRDYYEILAVSRTATHAEIKASYRKLALKYHPDRNPGDGDAEKKFKEASEAYDVLSDKQKRQTYDQFGHQGLGGQHGFHDVNDIFSSFGSIFEDFFGFGGGQGGARRGADLRYDLSLDLEEAIFGVDKQIEFMREKTCGTCHGSRSEKGKEPSKCATCGGVGQVRRTQGFFSVATPCPTCRGEGIRITHPCKSCHGKGTENEKKQLQVKIPAGVDSGVRLRVAGEGEGSAGGQPGDLYVMIRVKDHDIYERHGDDLLRRESLSFFEASLGCEREIDIFGEKEKLKISPGTQPGEQQRLVGKGVPRLKSGRKGDLFIEYTVDIPKKLSKKQREALLTASKEFGHSQSEGGFFDKFF